MQINRRDWKLAQISIEQELSEPVGSGKIEDQSTVTGYES